MIRDEKHHRILVLGLGNILLQDEGVGVYVVRKLERMYSFSPNVTLMDGGTLGIKLAEYIIDSDYLIAVDAVRKDSEPGTVHRLTLKDLQTNVDRKYSLHQVNFLETLAYVQMAFQMPKTVIIGMEAENTSDWGTELTEPVKAHLQDMEEKVLQEIKSAGGSFKRRSSGRRHSDDAIDNRWVQG